MRDSPTTPQRGGAMLPAARLWTRTSGKGLSYLAGRLGGVRVLVMPKRDGEEGDHTHMLLFAEAPPRDGEATEYRSSSTTGTMAPPRDGEATRNPSPRTTGFGAEAPPPAAGRVVQ